MQNISGTMGYRKAAPSFADPQTTLERKVGDARKPDKLHASKVINGTLGPKTTVFTAEEEKLDQ